MKPLTYKPLIIAAALVFTAPAFSKDKDNDVVIPVFSVGGRVVDRKHEPISGVEVKLFDENRELIKSDHTEHDGSFSLSHKECKKCLLEVIPDRESGLARALFEDIPGDKTRNFIVELTHGLLVTGRVMHDGKPLKGVEVEVVPLEKEDGHGKVHGGGFASTGKDGRFQMSLIPGRKHFKIYNDRYADVAPRHELDVTIESPVTLPDIVLGR